MNQSSANRNVFDRRVLLRRALLTGTAVGTVSLLGAGCSKSVSSQTGSGDTLKRIREQGTVRVGFANEAPYGFRDANGKLTGEAPEVARAIFKELGVDDLEPQLVDSFDNLIPGLVNAQYDIIAAGMFITPDRCGQISFSNPDYAAPSAFLVEEGNPRGIMTFDDAADKGAKVGVLAGAVEKGYAEKRGVSGDNIQVFQKADLAFQALLDGRVDTVALTSFTLLWTKQEKFKDDPVEVTEPFIPMIDGKEAVGAGGYGFRKSDSSLLEAFNAELKKLQDSGRLLEIVEPFGFDQLAVDKAKELTADDLCSA